MRYFIGLLVAAVLPALPQNVGAQTTELPTSIGSFVHGRGLLPSQFTLRASYYLYLDADMDTDATSGQTELNAEEPKSAEANGGVAPSESNLDETVSSSAPETQVPDIDTLSQRAIEHYEIHYKTPNEGRHKPNRHRRRAIALGVTIPIVVVGTALLVGAAVAMSNWEF